MPNNRIVESLPRYTGTKEPKLKDHDATGQPIRPYIATQEIVEAVDLAMFLRRPLLLRGEPGCGKTQLAQAVAFELGVELETWRIRSTTRAADGLYIYDAIRRLRDAQLAAVKVKDHSAKPDNVEEYIRFGPIGRAFRANKTTVLLIDEIDKADIDFPNDLLDVIDQLRFTVTETGQEIVAQYIPLIFITSNDEKELPDPFLRRCLFTFISFPDADRLQRILTAHFGRTPKSLVEQAVKRFLELRARQELNPLGSPKRSSTSELIDWFRALTRASDPKAKLTSGSQYPYPSTLIKRHEDMDALRKPMDGDKD